MTSPPKTERGRLSRERIVAAADALIAAHGVEGTSLDHVLQTARASKSQLYHYFSSKQDLVHAVVEHRWERHREVQLPLLDDLGTWAAIQQWFDMTVQLHERAGFPGCPIGTLANELASRDDAARVRLAACFATWESYLTEGLRRMRARGDLVPSADPAELATATFASIQGGLLLAKVRRDSQPLSVALDAALAHLRSYAPS